MLDMLLTLKAFISCYASNIVQRKKNYYRPESLLAMFARSSFSMILDTMNSGSLFKPGKAVVNPAAHLTISSFVFTDCIT